MNKVFFIILLFFSLSALAEVFNCEITIQTSGGEMKYSLLVDTGKKADLTITSADIDTGRFGGHILSDVDTLGKIFIDKGNPYDTKKIDTEVFFTYSSDDYLHLGLFFLYKAYPSTIEITRMNSDNWEIYITTTDFGLWRMQTGICD